MHCYLYVYMATQFETNSTKVSGSITPVIDYLHLNTVGNICNIEYKPDATAKALDRQYGIDWLLQTHNHGILGIASRIQFTQPRYYTNPHNSFTVRYDNVSGCRTEFSKRLDAIEHGQLHPFFTLQAYCQVENPGNVLSAAFMRTSDLYEFMTKYSYLVTEDRQDNTFKVCRWDDISRVGYTIYMKGESTYGYKTKRTIGDAYGNYHQSS